MNHDDIVPRLHFGSWSNPTFRDDLTKIAKLQIDGGADGIFFDVVESDFYGAGFDGNEGFDDYHLADFNSYLLAKYPAGTDFASKFSMTADNTLRADMPAGALGCSFNYRDYLSARGLTSTPFDSSNPLATEWTPTIGNRVAPGPLTFEDAVIYRHFGEVVAELRSYAHDMYGRDIYVTANGILPYVDFQSVGLYDFNHDGPAGGDFDYVPVAGGHLAGDRSLKETFLHLKDESAAVAPGAPVVLFIDWPTGTMTRYLGLPASERQDYWRIFAAEAYANGLFFSFFLSDTLGDPTATQLGIMPFFKSLSAFYRSHAGLYHHVTSSTDTVSVSLPSAMVSVADQAAPRRRLIHVVNHEYSAGLVEQDGVTVTVPLAGTPTSVTLASPDLAADVASIPFTYAGGKITVTLPTLVAYDAVSVVY